MSSCIFTQEMDTATQVRIPYDADCISLTTYVFGKANIYPYLQPGRIWHKVFL